jgi:hypothetical protein
VFWSNYFAHWNEWIHYCLLEHTIVHTNEKLSDLYKDFPIATQCGFNLPQGHLTIYKLLGHLVIYPSRPFACPSSESWFPDELVWALLIISKRLSLLKKLHLPAFWYPLTFSTFPLIKVNTGRGGAKKGLWVWNTPNRQVVRKWSNPSWMKRNTNWRLKLVGSISLTVTPAYSNSASAAPEHSDFYVPVQTVGKRPSLRLSPSSCNFLKNVLTYQQLHVITCQLSTDFCKRYDGL